MRIVGISDTHLIDVLRGETVIVPDGDVLVHCGDATMRGTYQEVAQFATRFDRYPHKHKLFVPGNHDWQFQIEHEKGNKFSEVSWADILIDSGVTIDGVKFWGSPWQPEFCNWAFNLPRGPELKKHWDLIPSDTKVLVTHTPPMGILDGVWNTRWEYDKETKRQEMHRYQEHVGCADMLLAVQRVKPKLHIFGHVHSAYGRVDGPETTFVNCALANEKYHLVHQPVVIDL